ncbi:MAG: CYTH domain-containing protein [Calditrichia bacterium]
MKKHPAQEWERKLLLPDPQFAALLSELRVKKEIGGLRVFPAARLHLQDQYFDTAEQNLQQTLYSLRLRSGEEKLRLTLKGPAEPAADPSLKRMEWEDAFSQAFLKKIINHLREQGMQLHFSHESLNGAEAAESLLKKAGFQLIQRRNTIRETFLLKQNGKTVAELAADRVEYGLPEGSIFHSELEIELKNSGNFYIFKKIIPALNTGYGGELKNWTISKLQLGEFLKKHSGEMRKKGFITGERKITNEGYECIRKEAGQNE